MNWTIRRARLGYLYLEERPILLSGTSIFRSSVSFISRLLTSALPLEG